MTKPREPYLSVSLHLHEAEIIQLWVPDPGEKCGGFVSLNLHDLSILIFTEEQADRLMLAACTARVTLAKHRGESPNDS